MKARQSLKTFFAIFFFMWSIVSVVMIIDAMHTAPVDSDKIALFFVIGVVAVTLGFLLLRRPRF